MKGLIIKERWLDLILSGKKTWEIRGSNTKIRGKIYLIQSGTSKIYASCEVVDSLPVNKNDLLKNTKKHQISKEIIKKGLRYKNPHAWVLDNVKILKKPRKYEHPQGAIIWVNI